MAIRKTKGTEITKKEFNLEKINEITAFMDGLAIELNPNFRGWVSKNPRKARLILEELNKIKEELKPMEIDIKEIDVERFFTRGMEKSDVENYLDTRGCAPLYSIEQDYKKILNDEVLEIINPKAKREEEIKKMEYKIKNMRDLIERLSRISGSADSIERFEREIDKTQRKIEAIKETFNVPTITVLRHDLHMYTNYYLNNLKERVDNAIEFINKAMELAK